MADLGGFDLLTPECIHMELHFVIQGKTLTNAMFDIQTTLTVNTKLLTVITWVQCISGLPTLY